MENTQKPFYKQKVFVIPAALLLLATIVSAAAVYYDSVNVDVTISEALSTTQVDVSLAGMPGETITQSITVSNEADVSLNTSVSWTQDTNGNSVDYDFEVVGGSTQTVPANGDLVLNATWTIANDSPIGAFNGTLTLNRV